MRIVQFLTVVAILAAGLCAAWPFRRPAPRVVEAQPSAAPLELTLRQTDVPADALPLHAVSPAVGLETAPAQFAPMSYHAKREERIVDLENLAPPPDLPLAFESARELASAFPTHDVQRPAFPEPPERLAPVPRPKTYRLRDGDTLEQLAERFLGSRDRAAEIFDANRDVLTHPDLLPVGCTLTIPVRGNAGG